MRKKSQCGTGFEMMHLFWCTNFRRHHSLRTSLCQFPSSLFPDARVGSRYDNSLPINGGLTGTPTSSQMVPVKNSGWFVFPIRTRSCVFLLLLCIEFYDDCNWYPTVNCHLYFTFYFTTQTPAIIVFLNVISSILPAEDIPLWLILSNSSTACK